MKKRLIIVGGGAAGVFAAATCSEWEVILLEKTRQLLAKVKISGGGRCNVTHHEFNPHQLIQNYPRGSQELLGPFHQFQPQDTVAWFKKHHVILKTEEDGRMFPITDSSETITSCLLSAARNNGVDIRCEQHITAIERADHEFIVHFNHGGILRGDALLLATGSSPQGHAWAASFGHTIVPAVPSLFSFNIGEGSSFALADLSGISLLDAELSFKEAPLKQRGNLLITHWGFSGPAALKLSAWAARFLHDKRYHVDLFINWVPSFTREEVLAALVDAKTHKPLKLLENENLFKLPQNLWKRLLHLSQVPEKTPLSHLSHQTLKQCAKQLTESSFPVRGKTTYKQEFVTSGGVDLKEIHFKRMESRLVPNLFFAGEILNIDGVTGGFNFQNAWTTAWLVTQALKSRSA
jgi:predicted Rossmann fold flavoprotein